MASRGKKRSKAFYTSAKRQKLSRCGGPSELAPGMQGVLITTGDQEKVCVPEAYNLLNQFGDQLYGPEFEASSNHSDQDDISTALNKEVTSLTARQEQRRFKAVNSGAKHVVFIACAPPVDPCELVHSLLSSVLAGGVRMSRYCQRVLPVVKVCHATLEDISKHTPAVLEPHFHEDSTKIIKYAVNYKARNNNVVKREDVIKAVASMVTMDGDYDHIVDLTNPDLTVVVEIIKNLCCLSVVKDFHRLSKYNIHMLTESKQIVTAGEGGIGSSSKEGINKQPSIKDSEQSSIKDSEQSSIKDTEQPSIKDSEQSSTKDTE